MVALAYLQGAYFLVTGAWAIAHIDSFQKITGRKTDLWLVKTVGVLLIVIGSGLILAGMKQQCGPGLILIGMGSAAGLIAIELVYVFKRVISPIYWADAMVEAGFIIGWAVCLPNA
jgi:hypothetical protein